MTENDEKITMETMLVTPYEKSIIEERRKEDAMEEYNLLIRKTLAILLAETAKLNNGGKCPVRKELFVNRMKQYIPDNIDISISQWYYYYTKAFETLSDGIVKEIILENWEYQPTGESNEEQGKNNISKLTS